MPHEGHISHHVSEESDRAGFHDPSGKNKSTVLFIMANGPKGLQIYFQLTPHAERIYYGAFDLISHLTLVIDAPGT